MNRRWVRVGAVLVALGAIPGLVQSSLLESPVANSYVANSYVANSSGVELVGGLLMLVGAAVLAVAWWRDATATESVEAGDVSG